MEYYTIYETTNIINHKTYTGAHKTNNLDDNYLGSGVLLKRSIKKYGSEKFDKKVIFRAKSMDIMYWIERMLVDEEYINRSDTYNLKIGGSGGWEHITSEMRVNQNKFKIGNKHSQEAKDKMSKASKGKKKSKTHCKNISLGQIGRKLSEEQKIQIGNFHRGKKMSKESITKRTILQSGIYHYNTKIIDIFDKNDNLLYTSNGSFSKFCKENDLPGPMLAYSMRNGGTKIYKNKSDSKFYNWSAKISP